MRVNRRKIKIEWGQCDPLGIVFYPQYFSMFDSGTHELFDSVGLTRGELKKRFGITGMPIVDTGAKFIVPSLAHDMIEMETKVVEWGRSSFRVSHKAFRGDTLAIEGFEVRVAVREDDANPGRIKGMAVPQEVVTFLTA